MVVLIGVVQELQLKVDCAFFCDVQVRKVVPVYVFLLPVSNGQVDLRWGELVEWR